MTEKRLVTCARPSLRDPQVNSLIESLPLLFRPDIGDHGLDVGIGIGETFDRGHIAKVPVMLRRTVGNGRPVRIVAVMIRFILQSLELVRLLRRTQAGDLVLYWFRAVRRTLEIMQESKIIEEVDTAGIDARVGYAGTRIDLDNVSKRYRVGDVDVTALDSVNLHIDEAAFVAIVGPSGCGKTTLLNMIGALDVPSSGTVRVAGVEATGASQAERAALRRHTVSFIFQTFNLFPGLTAFENVQFGADAAQQSDASERALEALGQVGLEERRRHFPHQLSGGEQQRVAIARALATGNSILLADEPTGELDFRTGVQILRVLEEQARAGMTVLVVTHNREIARVADRVIELSSGRIVADGPPSGGKADIGDLQW